MRIKLEDSKSDINSRISLLLARNTKTKQRKKVKQLLCSGQLSLVLLIKLFSYFKYGYSYQFLVQSSVMLLFSSHLGPVRRRTTAEEEERVNHPRPEVSSYVVSMVYELFC